MVRTDPAPNWSKLDQVVRKGVLSDNVNQNAWLASRNFPDDANNNNDSSTGEPSPSVSDPQSKADAKEK